MRLVAARQKSDSYIFTDVVEAEGIETLLLDMTDREAVNRLVDEKNIHSIVNCAAYTNVDKAETDVVLCRRLNAEAPSILADAMKRVGGFLVHISTDYVFGGDPYNVPCSEDQKGTPTGVYGQTKLEGEQAIQASGCQYVILRTAWLYSEYGKNFVKTMLNLTTTKPTLKVVFDQVGTPTYALDLAEAIATILDDYSREWRGSLGGEWRVESGERNVLDLPNNTQGEKLSSLHSPLSTLHPNTSLHYSKSGIYHYSNEGVCSWYDFTKMIQQIVCELSALHDSSSTLHQENLSTLHSPLSTNKCDIQPCHSDEFPSPVHRPAYSVLDKTKIKETFGLRIPYWTDSLRQCLTNLLL